MNFQADVLADVVEERLRQMSKYPEELPGQNLDRRVWLTLMMEEVGEVARAIIENKPEEYRAELVQVAALAVAAMEDYDASMAQ